MSYVLKRLSQLEPIANRRLYSAYVINGKSTSKYSGSSHYETLCKCLTIFFMIFTANFVAERFVNLIRPVLGGIMQRVEVFGTQKSQWMPKILRNLPKDQLPDWYGGEEGYKPRKIFG